MEIVSHTQVGDITQGFLESLAGKDVFATLDIDPDKVSFFIKSNRQKSYASSVVFAEPVTLVSYAAAILDVDKSFVAFLNENGVTEESFLNAATLVSDTYEKRKEKFRWWGRDSLSRIRSNWQD